MSGAIPVLSVFVSVTSTTTGTVTSIGRPLGLVAAEIDIDTGAAETETDCAAEVDVVTSLSPLYTASTLFIEVVGVKVHSGTVRV
jgi:hypothetical protein